MHTHIHTHTSDVYYVIIILVIDYTWSKFQLHTAKTSSSLLEQVSL